MSYRERSPDQLIAIIKDLEAEVGALQDEVTRLVSENYNLKAEVEKHKTKLHDDVFKKIQGVISWMSRFQ